MSGRAFTITISVILLLGILFVLDWPVSVVDNVCGGTPKSGDIETETWDVAGSPYWIEGNVTVLENETLTIEPGVEVRFNGYYCLWVEGNLYSIGVPNNRITFTSNTPSPSEGDWIAIQINYSGHVEISYSNITYASTGLYIVPSDNIITSNNISSNLNYGVFLGLSHRNNISNNIISYNGFGIHLQSSNYNTIENNNIFGNEIGMDFQPSIRNKVVGNLIANNSWGLCKDYDSNNNEIYYNNFIGNLNQAWDQRDDDWDNGAEGNYWDDYDGIDGDFNGIGDTPYIIDGDSKDNYPLMYVYPDISAPIINLNSPKNNSVAKAGTLIDFFVSDPNLKEVEYSINDSGYSLFISPYDIATETWQDGYYSIKVRASDTSGKKNSSEYYIEIDSTKPMITLNLPINNSVINAGTIIDFIVTDNNLKTVNYSVNDETFLILHYPFDLYTNDWIDNICNIEINANDLAGNEDSKSYIFTIDSTVPLINLTSPSNNSLVQPGILLKFEISDNNLKEVKYSVDNGINQSLAAPFEINTLDWADGMHVLEIFTKDLAGNEKRAFYLYIIDGTSPEIEDIFPMEDSINIPINTSIIVIFTEPMNGSTVESDISITPYLEYSCSWSNDNKTLFLIFSEPLAYDALYKITIGTNSEDLVGHKLENPYELEFTTEKKPKEEGFPSFYLILIMLLITILAIIVIIFIIVKNKKHLKG